MTPIFIMFTVFHFYLLTSFYPFVIRVAVLLDFFAIFVYAMLLLCCVFAKLLFFLNYKRLIQFFMVVYSLQLKFHFVHLAKDTRYEEPSRRHPAISLPEVPSRVRSKLLVSVMLIREREEEAKGNEIVKAHQERKMKKKVLWIISFLNLGLSSTKSIYNFVWW